jgi:hypothetical protein
MAWKAWLSGHELDLATLAELFAQGDPLVANDPANGYYIESPAIGTSDNQPDHAAAQALMKRVNGIARAVEDGFRPVGLGGRFSDPGGNVSVVLLADTIRARSKVTVGMGGGQHPFAPLPTGARYAALAAVRADIADALRVLGQADDLDWYDLYKAYEIVSDSAGGSARIVTNGWATKSDLDRFTASANHPDISGDGARHARQKGTAPANRAMTMADADRLIRQLVRACIEADPSY